LLNCVGTIQASCDVQCITGYDSTANQITCRQDETWNADPSSLCKGQGILNVLVHLCTTVKSP